MKILRMIKYIKRLVIMEFSSTITNIMLYYIAQSDLLNQRFISMFIGDSRCLLKYTQRASKILSVEFTMFILF